MPRKIIDSASDAENELPSQKSLPAWFERQDRLPFSQLTGDEFEILCFLLLKKMYPDDRVYYYGKTSDMGRDIMHHCQNGNVRLIQCKNNSETISPSVISADMAKVYANIHLKKIPVTPHEVVFWVSPDLSAMSQDLLDSQEEWKATSERYLKKHLK